jgi:uncharacterized membrane protein
VNRIARLRVRLPGPEHLRQAARTTPVVVWALAMSGWIMAVIVDVSTPESALSVVQAPAAFVFVLLCPGLAVARLLPLREPVEVWVCGVALSMSFGLLVSVAFTFLRDNSTVHRLLTLAAVATAAALVEIYLSARRIAAEHA